MFRTKLSVTICLILWAYPLVVYILYLALPCIHKTRLFMMAQLAFSCCKLFISEGRNAEALDSVEKDAKVHPDVDVLVNVFQYKDYNHAHYTLVFSFFSSQQRLNSPPQDTMFGIVRVELHAINLEEHSGTHPILLVVNHIC